MSCQKILFQWITYYLAQENSEEVANGRGEEKRSERKDLKIKKKGIPTLWSQQEKEDVFRFFKINIKNGIVPGKVDCEKCLAANKSLKNRDWKKIKFCVKNQIDKLNKIKKKTLWIFLELNVQRLSGIIYVIQVIKYICQSFFFSCENEA